MHLKFRFLLTPYIVGKVLSLSFLVYNGLNCKVSVLLGIRIHD